MDATHFDQLAKALSRPGARRGLLHVLATLPLLGGLASFLGEEDAAAKGRRRRRRRRHKHGQGRHKRKRKRKKPRKCKAKSRAKTCAGKCGVVKNNCQKTVNCGSCACEPPCDVCYVCNAETGDCEPDPDQQGDACGEPGQVCQDNGDCACTESSCPACTTCGVEGACQGCAGCCDGDTCVDACGDCQVCDDGQCAGCPDCCDAEGVCQPGDTDAACGSSGTCAVCTGQEQCKNQSCVCVPDCAGKSCGADDGCGGTCTACPPGQICAGQTCVTGQGSCAAGDDFCSDGGKTCNGGCRCRITTEGDTRCGGAAPGGGSPATCGECADSSDCATLYPAVIGAFCMAGGTGCCNGTAPDGLCIAPCPT